MDPTTSQVQIKRRRRRPYLKTTRSCNRCQRKHLRCDDQTSCSHCVKLGVPCHRALRWRHQANTERSSTSTSETRTIQSKGDFSLIFTPPTSPISASIVFTEKSECLVEINTDIAHHKLFNAVQISDTRLATACVDSPNTSVEINESSRSAFSPGQAPLESSIQAIPFMMIPADEDSEDEGRTPWGTTSEAQEPKKNVTMTPLNLAGPVTDNEPLALDHLWTQSQASAHENSLIAHYPTPRSPSCEVAESPLAPCWGLPCDNKARTATVAQGPVYSMVIRDPEAWQWMNCESELTSSFTNQRADEDSDHIWYCSDHAQPSMQLSAMPSWLSPWSLVSSEGQVHGYPQETTTGLKGPDAVSKNCSRREVMHPDDALNLSLVRFCKHWPP